MFARLAPYPEAILNELKLTHRFFTSNKFLVSKELFQIHFISNQKAIPLHLGSLKSCNEFLIRLYEKTKRPEDVKHPWQT